MSNETSPEDDYFAREDVVKRHKLAAELAAKQTQAEAAALKAAHFMKCPKCGNDLATIKFKGLDIDRCFSCQGTWLDSGELEKLAGGEEQHKVLSAIVNVFRRT